MLTEPEPGVMIRFCTTVDVGESVARCERMLVEKFTPDGGDPNRRSGDVIDWSMVAIDDYVISIQLSRTTGQSGQK
jgi:hypothetical protein